MIKPALPANETERIAALQRYRVLDTARDSVAIGARSIADRAPLAGTEGTVSFGSTGKERQLVNVAAGTEATDDEAVVRVVEHHCSLLANLVTDAYYKVVIAKFGGARILSTILRRFQSYATIQESSLRSLVYLAHSPYLQEKQGTGIKIILRSMQAHPSSIHVQSAACQALWSILNVKRSTAGTSPPPAAIGIAKNNSTKNQAVTAAKGRPNAFSSALLGNQAGSISYLPQQGWNNTRSTTVPTTYSFSTAALDGAVVVQTPGTVTKKLRVLNMDTVKDILKELNAVDRNSDGR